MKIKYKFKTEIIAKVVALDPKTGEVAFRGEYPLTESEESPELKAAFREVFSEVSKNLNFKVMSPADWIKEISKIENDDMRLWVGSIVWWDHAGISDKKVDPAWNDFNEIYISGYLASKEAAKLTQDQLCEALKKIDYPYAENRAARIQGHSSIKDQLFKAVKSKIIPGAGFEEEMAMHPYRIFVSGENSAKTPATKKKPKRQIKHKPTKAPNKQYISQSKKDN